MSNNFSRFVSTALRLDQAGFSLIELLLYSVLTVISLGGLVTALVADLRSGTSLQTFQQSLSRWKRLNRLLSTEIAEADQILYGANVACAGSQANSIFTFRIPYISNPAEGSPNLRRTTIHYYSNNANDDAGNQLWRCGPGYLPSGELNLTSIPPDLFETKVMDRTTIAINDQKSNQRTMQFTVSLRSVNGDIIFQRPRSNQSAPIVLNVGISMID